MKTKAQKRNTHSPESNVLEDLQSTLQCSEGSALAQWKSAWLDTDGPRVQASPASLPSCLGGDVI